MIYKAQIKTYTTVNEAGYIYPNIEYDIHSVISESVDNALDFANIMALFKSNINYIMGSDDKNPEFDIRILCPNNNSTYEKSHGTLEKYERKSKLNISQLEVSLKEYIDQPYNSN